VRGRARLGLAERGLSPLVALLATVREALEAAWSAAGDPAARLLRARALESGRCRAGHADRGHADRKARTGPRDNNKF